MSTTEKCGRCDKELTGGIRVDGVLYCPGCDPDYLARRAPDPEPPGRVALEVAKYLRCEANHLWESLGLAAVPKKFRRWADALESIATLLDGIAGRLPIEVAEVVYCLRTHAKGMRSGECAGPSDYVLDRWADCLEGRDVGKKTEGG